ncbi:MAG: spore maturation protein [Deltaproteobacteria bacterium]|nr:spore maturation protein [Deltaproteobacteria bacterium]
MNVIFFGLVAVSFLVAAFTGHMGDVTAGAIEAAGNAVELAIGLVGIMALFLGLMQVVQEAGGLRFLARAIRPLLVRLFPDVPPDHPAMGAMIMNLAANMLGLANAATPFGIRAMQELDRLNGRRGTATDAMALFLAINTSSVTLLPTGVIGLRAALGSEDAAGILPTTLFATAFSTVGATIACLLMARMPWFRRSRPEPASDEDASSPHVPVDAPAEAREDLSTGAASLLPLFAVGAVLAGFVTLALVYGQEVSAWIIPGLVVGMLLVGVVQKVRVYEVFIQGAKEGFNVALRIIPYLVAILVAVGMFRSSGALGFFTSLLGPFTDPLGLPAEALPMALLRPLSGSGAYGVMAEILKTHGPDTYVGYLVSTLQGSSETTFYVLAVYFGAVGVTRLRHAMWAGILADLFGVIGAVTVCRILYGAAAGGPLAP